MFMPSEYYQQLSTQVIEIPQEIQEFLCNTPSGRALCNPLYQWRFNGEFRSHISEDAAHAYDDGPSTSLEYSSSASLALPSSVGPILFPNTNPEIPTPFLDPVGFGPEFPVAKTVPDLLLQPTLEYNVHANTTYRELSTEQTEIFSEAPSDSNSIQSSSYPMDHIEDAPIDGGGTGFPNDGDGSVDSLYSGHAGTYIRGPAVADPAPLPKIVKEKPRGASCTPQSILPLMAPFPYYADRANSIHGNGRSHTQGVLESFGSVMPIHHTNLTNPNRTTQNGRSSTGLMSSTPPYERELAHQKNTLNSVTRAGKRTHSDETVVENNNSQQSSSQSGSCKRAKTANIQEAEHDEMGKAPKTTPTKTAPKLRSAAKKDLDSEDILTPTPMSGLAKPSNTSATKTGKAQQSKRNGKDKAGQRKPSPDEQVNQRIPVTSPPISHIGECSTASPAIWVSVDPTAPKRKRAPNGKARTGIPSKSAPGSDSVWSIDSVFPAPLSEDLLPINMNAISYVPKEVVEATKKHNDEYAAQVEADRQCGVEPSPIQFVFRFEK